MDRKIGHKGWCFAKATAWLDSWWSEAENVVGGGAWSNYSRTVPINGRNNIICTSINFDEVARFNKKTLRWFLISRHDHLSACYYGRPISKVQFRSFFLHKNEGHFLISSKIRIAKSEHSMDRLGGKLPYSFYPTIILKIIDWLISYYSFELEILLDISITIIWKNKITYLQA